MRKAFACFTFVLLAVAAIGATREQATVMSALDKLEMEKVTTEVKGGLISYKVTKKTVEFLTRAMNNGSSIIIEKDGSITIVWNLKK